MRRTAPDVYRALAEAQERTKASRLPDDRKCDRHASSARCGRHAEPGREADPASDPAAIRQGHDTARNGVGKRDREPDGLELANGRFGIPGRRRHP